MVERKSELRPPEPYKHTATINRQPVVDVITINCLALLIIHRWRFNLIVLIPYHFLRLLIDLVRRIVAISGHRINYRSGRSVRLRPLSKEVHRLLLQSRFAFYQGRSIAIRRRGLQFIPPFIWSSYFTIENYLTELTHHCNLWSNIF